LITGGAATGQCRKMCDDTHPCPGSQTCTNKIQPTLGSMVGSCN
jgi:hypothetical protein